MLSKTKSLKFLSKFFKKNKVGVIADLCSLLETSSHMSVFRRLKELDYITSYSNAGKYYSLSNIANYNHFGIWEFNSIKFSKFGTLKDTVVNLIEQADFGKTHSELENILKVRVHNTLLNLVNLNKISRQQINNIFVYTSNNKTKAKKQIKKRKETFDRYMQDILPDWLIIEILVAIIQSNTIEINVKSIIKALNLKKITVTAKQIELTLDKLALKKTPGLKQ